MVMRNATLRSGLLCRCLFVSGILLPFGCLVRAQEEPAPAPELMFQWPPRDSAASGQDQAPGESKANKSLDLSALSPLAEQLNKLGIHSGFYDFDEGVEDQVVKVKDRNEVSFANRTHFQSEYHVNPILQEENGFVGFWASFPLRAPGEKDAGTYERLRTRRELPTDQPAEPAAGAAPSGDPVPVQPVAPKATKGAFATLFKPKPKPGLIPTGALPPASTGIGSSPFAESAPVSEAEALSSPAVIGNQVEPLQPAAAPAAPAAPSPERTPRLLGRIPPKSSSQPASANAAPEKRRISLAEQLFGKPSPPTRRTPPKSSPWSRR